MPLVRYARELGWLEVYDADARRWVEAWAKDCPAAWRRQAHLEKQHRRGDPPGRSVSRQTREEAFAF